MFALTIPVGGGVAEITRITVAIAISIAIPIKDGAGVAVAIADVASLGRDCTSDMCGWQAPTRCQGTGLREQDEAEGSQ